MDILLGFKNTFNELLQDRDIGVIKLSMQLHMLPSIVSKWKNSLVDLKLKSLIKLVDFFDCSLDYICGRSNMVLDYNPKVCPKFGERIVTVLKACNCSSYKLFQNTSIKPAQYHHWRTGTEPLLSSLGIIADYLGITLDYLVGRDR